MKITIEHNGSVCSFLDNEDSGYNEWLAMGVLIHEAVNACRMSRKSLILAYALENAIHFDNTETFDSEKNEVTVAIDKLLSAYEKMDNERKDNHETTHPKRSAGCSREGAFS